MSTGLTVITGPLIKDSTGVVVPEIVDHTDDSYYFKHEFSSSDVTPQYGTTRIANAIRLVSLAVWEKLVQSKGVPIITSAK